MTRQPDACAGHSRPTRPYFTLTGAVAALLVAAAPVPLPSYSAAAAVQGSVRVVGGQGVSDFYAARAGRPLWIGRPGRQAEVLLEILGSAQLDGLDPGRYQVDRLTKAVRSARNGDPSAVRRADAMLSQALVSYVRDLRRPSDIGVVYVDRELMPGPPSPRAILEAAAAAPSLERYTAEMRWMHPIYASLRHALMEQPFSTGTKPDTLRLNLERARELPAGNGRHLIVNSAAQRLHLYENGTVVDSMRVVVGQPKNPTPMMAALIRYTSLNPYWNVPSDLAAERIAPNVRKLGLSYLRQRGYQVLTDWGERARLVDPETVDWEAVVEGRELIVMRQLPGPDNAMGRMKFMFPNAEGVYLHDTPEKELLTEASRLFSGGCVRLEDAPRLALWLHGERLQPKGARAEQKVPLPKPVPVFLTYLTAVPSGSQIAYFDDIYGLDAKRLAQLDDRGFASR